MILYVNGDSHSAGHDAGGPEFAYGRHIANALNAEYVCDAVPGCSNQTIIDRTRRYLEKNNPDFLIIGWSTWERETWHWEGCDYNITASGTDSVPPALKEKYKQWVIDQDLPEVQWQREYNAHDEIWKFHQELSDKNVSHLFFNCYHHFFYIERQNRTRYEWGANYIDPYDQNMTYYFWLDHQGYKPANPEFYHYSADAHEAWADFLLPKVQKLLTTT